MKLHKYCEKVVWFDVEFFRCHNKGGILKKFMYIKKCLHYEGI